MAKESKAFKVLRDAVVAQDLIAASKVIDKVAADAYPFSFTNGASLLMVAIKMGAAMPLIQLLVERGGASYEYEAPDGRTPIVDAQQEDRRDVIEYFSSRGAKVVYVSFAALAQTDKDLRLAEIVKDWTNARLVTRITNALAAGANPNALVIDGKASLHYLAYHSVQHIEAWQALLDGGADPTRCCTTGATPLHLLSDGASNLAIATLLLTYVSLEIRDTRGRTPLHCAAASEYWDASKYVQLLLDAGADIDARDNDGMRAFDLANGDTKKLFLAATAVPLTAATTMLLTAISANDAAAVGAALLAGADPCAVDASGRAWGPLSGIAALHLMYGRGVSQSIVDTLLASGPRNINVRATDNMTPLHYMLAFAEQSPWRDRLTALLALGADVNAADDRGETVLQQMMHLHSSADRHELYQLLVKAGADPAKVDDGGESVLAKLWEWTQRFSKVSDKKAFVRLLAKLALDLPADRVTPQVKAWLSSEGAKFLSENVADELAAAAAAGVVVARHPQFVAITEDKLAAYRGQTTCLPIAGEVHKVALFDWFTLLQEQADKRHEIVDELRRYHIPWDAKEQVEAVTWVPFGIVGMTGALDSYEDSSEELGVAGTLFIELAAASDTDAPVIFVNQNREYQQLGSFRDLIAQVAIAA